MNAFNAMDSLPNEMWLRIFGLVEDAPSLAAVVLVCRRFLWRSVAVALRHLQFWERNPGKVPFVRSLSLRLAGAHNDPPSGNNERHDRIFAQIQTFHQLQHLKFVGGELPGAVYATLQRLPSVTELILEACLVPPPPPHFPLSFPSIGPPPEIHVTRLTVSKLLHRPTMGFDPVTVPLACHLPHLRTFVTDSIDIQMPFEAYARLTSLTVALFSVGIVDDMHAHLVGLLRLTPLLEHLDVSTRNDNWTPSPAGENTSDVPNLSTTPVAPLPLLRALSAPWPAAVHVLLGAPALEHLRVTSQINKPGDALWLLEHLHGAGSPVRTAALSLASWEDEVLIAAAHCLPACRALEVAYHAGAPDDAFLFNLGIHHLPLLQQLHTLRLLPPAYAGKPPVAWDPAPAPVVSSAVARALVPRSMWPEIDEVLAASEQKAAAARCAERARAAEAAAAAQHARRERAEAVKEYVHAWARYNPALKRVRLGAWTGCAWVRRAPGTELGAGGGRRKGKDLWDVDTEDENAQAARWAAMCVADGDA
ncbi:hypothetical protein GGX14DRAFT_461796 [Mycena pura]|uniref:F-box domain-containing protein n=1 Tax=Mycena pura TaxID=153505 RepID=A0AAD6V992_9AGAR|nr:hypothetical protein GGX14DRAFT_461796 [Mycena pura]